MYYVSILLLKIGEQRKKSPLTKFKQNCESFSKSDSQIAKTDSYWETCIGNLLKKIIIRIIYLFIFIE